jgi:hypothetical protein
LKNPFPPTAQSAFGKPARPITVFPELGKWNYLQGAQSRDKLPVAMETLIGIILLASVAALSYLLWNDRAELGELRTRLAGIDDLNRERDRIRNDIQAATRQKDAIDKELSLFSQRAKSTEAEIIAKQEQLAKEISSLEEHLEDLSFGLYEPHFSFTTPDEYKAALENLRDEEREMIRAGKAATCPLNWTIGNDKRAGARMTKQYTKLLLRAFNGECDAALANVSWNNVDKMIERIRKAFQALNELGSVMQMSLHGDYLKIKIDELRLTYELEQKKQDEREEQRRIRLQIREEEKAQRDFEKAQADAEKEEEIYQKALTKVREEALGATGEQLRKLTEQISTFEEKLEEAKKVKERAISRAQLTKSGFVYVISNIGSFGERVFKIGMTRRMEPMDRVDELGDASVPFPFDLHAMLYSDNAPELESALHSLVEERRVNLVNRRKEFYRNVDLVEIETFVRNRGLSAQFIHTVEAREYKETQVILATQQINARGVAAGMG